MSSSPRPVITADALGSQPSWRQVSRQYRVLHGPLDATTPQEVMETIGEVQTPAEIFADALTEGTR